MITVRLSDLQLPELGYQHDADARVSGTFPFSVASGNASTAMVYFELEPGKRLPTHTDSAEEILLILEGTTEATVGSERAVAKAGDLVLVPTMVPHSVQNVGSGIARVLGFFPSATLMSTFEHPLVPMDPPADMGSPFGTRTVLAPLPIALETQPVAVGE